MSRGSAIDLSKRALRRELKGARQRARGLPGAAGWLQLPPGLEQGPRPRGGLVRAERGSLRWHYNVPGPDVRRLGVDGGERLASAAGATGPRSSAG